MPQPYISHRRVEFRDTDAAGIMHFSVFFTYMEQVEHEFLRWLGTSVVAPLTESGTAPGGKLSWPRVAAECQYSGSARFEDQLEIELHVAQLGTSSVTYRFHFRVAGREIATGSLTTVCCKILPDHPPVSLPIPEHLRQLLAAE
jgi:4-hydroxybenzoyl-CoA thioesterase/acyl-CoA thioester hydrolase